MIAVRVMQVTVHQIVDMVAVRDRLMAAPAAMLVPGVVAASRTGPGAAVRMLAVDGDPVLIDMPFVRVMQVTVVQIVDMAVVVYRDVTAIRPVLVLVVCVNRMIVLTHVSCLSLRIGTSST